MATGGVRAPSASTGGGGGGRRPGAAIRKGGRKGGGRPGLARRRRGRKGSGPGFKRPPLGTFDPGLEAQRRSSQRGLSDLIADTARAGHRAEKDYGTQTALTQRTAERGRFDITQSFTRDLEDLAVARQRGEEDYTRALGGLTRRYETLAQRHGELSRQAGVGRDRGTQAASLKKRTQNQAFEREPIDVEKRRLGESLAQREGRLTSDKDLGLGRLAENLATQLEQQALGYKRSTTDRGLKLSRAKREQGIYEQDVTQQEYFQAHQYDPTIRFPRKRFQRANRR